jgi:aromatic O-demethylase, cytochrome P450 subunit
MPQPSWIDEITFADLEGDPYRVYERLRREAPLAFVPALGAWVASSWRHCQLIATDSENFGGAAQPSLLRTFGNPNVLSAEGEIHRDLRAMLDPGLRAREVRRYVDDLVRPVARRQVEALRGQTSAELMATYCEPVSVRALGDLLGLRDVDSDTLRQWFHALSSSFANAAVDAEGNFLYPEGFEAGDAARQEIHAVLDPLLEQWRTQPEESGISRWMRDGMPEGELRQPEHIYPTLYVILLGGMQEPGHALGSTLCGLFSRPEQYKEVRDDKQLLSRAVNEGLRWTAPIWGAVSRTAKRPVVVDGIDIREGDVVMVTYGSANWDDTEFENPTVFDMHRSQHPHLSFGAGQHACAGAAFAPQLVRIALEELLEVLPTLEPDPEHQMEMWGWAFRGPKELHVKW